MAHRAADEAMNQEIQYCTTSDGIRLAYSIIGKGNFIVRTPHWMAHLENDLTGPIFRHQILGLAHHHSLLRYDGRGLGLSQRDVTDISFERVVDDLETVVDRAGLDRFILVGLSQGAAVAVSYASRHPERLSHLVLYGGFARGILHMNEVEQQEQKLETMCALIRQGWGSDQAAYREFFTSQFIVDGTLEHHRWLNDAQRAAATPEVAERILRMNADINVIDLLPKVKVPTLVMHCRGDTRVPFSMGQEIAANIPGAKFVPLDSRNHIILSDEPANRQLFDAIALFLGERPMRGPLPGTTTLKGRVDRMIGALERNWIIKTIVILASIAGVLLFVEEVWRALR
jgi:pimeloyl-ACP methyl ester carboxylesterase